MRRFGRGLLDFGSFHHRRLNRYRTLAAFFQVANFAHLPARRSVGKFLDIDRVGDRAREFAGIESIALASAFGIRALPRFPLGSAGGAVEPNVDLGARGSPEAILLGAPDPALDGRAPDAALFLQRFHRDGDDWGDRALFFRPPSTDDEGGEGEIADVFGSARTFDDLD